VNPLTAAHYIHYRLTSNGERVEGGAQLICPDADYRLDSLVRRNTFGSRDVSLRIEDTE
jgi:hypothetical protein